MSLHCLFTCSMKIALEEVERDRDAYKYKLSEKNRELDRLSEQVHIQISHCRIIVVCLNVVCLEFCMGGWRYNFFLQSLPNLLISLNLIYTNISRLKVLYFSICDFCAVHPCCSWHSPEALQTLAHRRRLEEFCRRETS